MVIRHDVNVNQPAHSCRRELLEPPAEWLPGQAAGPAGEGRFFARVGFGASAARVSKQVELVVGRPAVGEHDWLVAPLSWHATGPGVLFPALDAQLTVRPLGTHSARLVLSGTYQPPLGGVGQKIDHAVLHRVAEGTIKDFVEAVAARLSERAASRPA